MNPFADLKHNIKFNEFTTTGLERCDTELKLMATGYNFKRIFNENEQKIQFIRKKKKKKIKRIFWILEKIKKKNWDHEFDFFSKFVTPSQIIKKKII